MAVNYEMNKLTKKGWTKQPNALLIDQDLTSDAYKVISFLLSITGNYNISIRGISKTINISESKVKRAVDLLQDTGYLRIIKVRNGKYFGGYKWLISDTSGTYRKYTDDISMDGISIPATSNYGISKDGISIHETSMDAPLYQYTERYEQTNNERQKNEHTESNEPLLHQPDAEVESPLTASKRVSSWESSSEADASPLSGKNTGNVEPVLSQKEYLYRQFLNKYPKAPLNREQELTRQAFFDIPNLEYEFDQIMSGLEEWCRSPEWHKDNGRYIKKPLNWIKERQWEKVNTLDAYMERLNQLFPTEEV